MARRRKSDGVTDAQEHQRPLREVVIEYLMYRFSNARSMAQSAVDELNVCDDVVAVSRRMDWLDQHFEAAAEAEVLSVVLSSVWRAENTIRPMSLDDIRSLVMDNLIDGARSPDRTAPIPNVMHRARTRAWATVARALRHDAGDSAERVAILKLIEELEAEHRRYAKAEKDPRWEAVAATLAILRDRIGRGEHRK